MMRIILLLAFVMIFLSSRGQDYTISGLIEVFNSEDRCHELLTEDGYNYTKDYKWWRHDDMIVRFTRFPDGEKQLEYEFFSKRLFTSLEEQLQVMNFTKLAKQIDGRDVYCNDKYFIALYSYQMNYEGMEVTRFGCTIERTAKVKDFLNELARQGEDKIISHNGVKFKIPSNWQIDSVSMSNTVIVCYSERSAFRVDFMPLKDGVDSVTQRTIAKIALDEVNELPGVSVSNITIGWFSTHKSDIVEFVQNVDDLKIFGKRYVFFVDGKTSFAISMTTIDPQNFKSSFQTMMSSFKYTP